jgi:NTE family protein
MSEISLALSGGGARGAYHLGVLQRIDDMGISVKAICGTSIGATIGTSYLAGVKPKRQLEIFKSHEFRDIFSFNYFRKSIFKINYEAQIINDLIPCDSLEKLSMPMFVTALDLISGKELYYSSGAIPKLCFGSSALVPLLSPIKHDDLLLADGGFVNHMPYLPLLEYSHPIIGVNLHPVSISTKQDSMYEFLKRTIYINTYSNSKNSESHCDTVVTNDKLREYSLVSFKYLDEMFELGYTDSERLLAKYIKI